MNSIIHIRNAVFVNSERKRIVLSLFLVFVIWMKEITEMRADSFTVQKLWHRVMIVVIFMLQK